MGLSLYPNFFFIDKSMRNRFVFFIFVSIWINTSETQTVYTCDSPEKESYCTLKCKTKDFLQPVTFSHPSNRDVGSCIPPDPCRSNYGRYSLSQKKIGTENITYFHIYPLSREDDEGKWICSYGNKASTVKYLTVHRRPENVDLSVNETGSSIIVKCSYYCVNYPEFIRMEIQISNNDRTIKTNLNPLKSLDVPEHKCLADENTIIGKYNVQKDKLPGNYIDISCSCTEEKLHYTHTTNKRFSYQGIPKQPIHFKTNVKSAHSVVLNWKKSANGGSTQTFVIQYTDVLAKLTHNITMQENEKAEYNTTLERLKSDTEYRVWIYSYNNNGKSTKYGPVSFTTSKEETPPLLAIKLPIILIAIAVIIIIVFLQEKKKNRQKKIGEEYPDPFLGEERDANKETLGDNSRMNIDANKETLGDNSRMIIDANKETLGDNSRMNIENTKAPIKKIVQPDFFVKTT